ncbi:MAG: hypothetical protein EKK55_10365 [Rhodocyclaceae bacterium]|nr:MAG: hypothetical protein EKK55_10365 [Rhodocyclaceae bacterium]
MKLTVGDLLDLVIDLTARTYGREAGEVGGGRFRILPRAEWPALDVTVQVTFWRTPHGGDMEARGPFSTAVVAKPEGDDP